MGGNEINVVEGKIVLKANEWGGKESFKQRRRLPKSTLSQTGVHSKEAISLSGAENPKGKWSSVEDTKREGGERLQKANRQINGSL